MKIVNAYHMSEQKINSNHGNHKLSHEITTQICECTKTIEC